jgi:hypothetical protein
MDSVGLEAALRKVRHFGAELQGLAMREVGSLVALRYARDRMIAELAKLNAVLAVAEAEERLERQI